MSMQKQNINRIRGVAFAVAILSLLSMVGNTFAYWTDEISVKNEYQTATYLTEIVEEFESPSDWLPGMEVSKEVSISNNGTLPVFAKVILNQSWIRTENIYDVNDNLIPPARGDSFPLTYIGTTGPEYAALIGWGDVVLLSSGVLSVPSLNLDLPMVNTITEAEGKWLLLREIPDINGNYILYYIGTLDAGTTSLQFIEGVKINPNISATVLEDRTVWDKDNQQWVTTVIENPTHSYENAKYILSVTIQTVQATEDALLEVLTASNSEEQAIIDGLKVYAFDAYDINYSYDDDAVHILYFDNISGDMVFTPLRNGSDAWFISDLNMVPGGEYSHILKIENNTLNQYDLYMQVIPIEQSDMLNELLEYISMKVWYGTELIYDGTAMGKEYIGSINDLHNVIYLGNYEAGDEHLLKVELLLHKDTPIEYSGLLTEIDWQFNAEEDEGSVIIRGEKTWDHGQNTTLPTSITILVLANTNVVVEKVVTASDGWKWEFELPRYDDEGNIIQYTIDEVDISGYYKEIEGSNIKNTYITDAVIITVTKTWNHGSNDIVNHPESITIVIKDGNKVVAKKIVTAAEGWEWSFELPKYDDTGQEIIYTVDELYVPEYTKVINGYNIKNTYKQSKTTQKATSRPDSPKTGDNSNRNRYILVMTICGLSFMTCLLYLILTRKRMVIA